MGLRRVGTELLRGLLLVMRLARKTGVRGMALELRSWVPVCLLLWCSAVCCRSTETDEYLCWKVFMHCVVIDSKIDKRLIISNTKSSSIKALASKVFQMQCVVSVQGYSLWRIQLREALESCRASIIVLHFITHRRPLHLQRPQP